MDACYIVRSSQIVLANEGIPCSNGTGIRQCCGRQHTCGADGFCRFTGQAVGKVSGFYLGGCTDASFTDPACPQHCKTRAFQDVTYSSSSGLWSCCVQNSTVDCTNPSDETFTALDPQELFTSSTTSGSITSAASTITTTTIATSDPSTITNNTSQPSTKVAASTIAAATVVPILGILVIIAFFLWWRRQKSSQGHKMDHIWADQYTKLIHKPHADNEGSKMPVLVSQELENKQRAEMSADGSVAELEGRSVSEH